MNIKGYLLSALIVAMMSNSTWVNAEVKKNRQAKPDDWSQITRSKPLNNPQVISEHAQSANQLRCWQEGELIVLENGMKPTDSKKGRLMVKNGKQFRAYDFGETFCVYFGG